MSALAWVGVGAGAMFALGVAASLSNRDGREALAQLVASFVAIVMAPVLAIGYVLTKYGQIGGTALDGRSLERFARSKHRGGGRAFVLHWSPRLGVMWVRGLRDNEPVRPIRVRDIDPEWRKAGDES